MADPEEFLHTTRGRVLAVGWLLVVALVELTWHDEKTSISHEAGRDGPSRPLTIVAFAIALFAVAGTLVTIATHWLPAPRRRRVRRTVWTVCAVIAVTLAAAPR